MEDLLSKGAYVMITAEEVIWKILIAIYSNDVLSEKMYLKGGQALITNSNSYNVKLCFPYTRLLNWLKSHPLLFCPHIKL